MNTASGMRTYWQQLWACLWRRGGGVALVCSLCMGAQSVYSAMLPMSLDYLAKTADTVVLGTVARQVSAWDAHYTAIHTDVTLVVERVVLGTPGAEVTFRVAGGIVGGMGMRTSNDAQFQDGERVIVFLDTNTTPGSVVGMQQGKILVQENTVTAAGTTLPVDDYIAAIRAAAP